MSDEWKKEVLEALYDLEEPLINKGEYESIWHTPRDIVTQIAKKIPDAKDLGLDESGARTILDELWIARKIILFPIEPS